MPGIEEEVGVVIVGLGIPTLGAQAIPFVEAGVGGQTVRHDKDLPERKYLSGLSSTPNVNKI